MRLSLNFVHNYWEADMIMKFNSSWDSVMLLHILKLWNHCLSGLPVKIKIYPFGLS